MTEVAPNLCPPMTTDRLGVTDGGRRVELGTTVGYRGHVVGGMVRVRFADGTEDIMHPHCFKSLRE